MAYGEFAYFYDEFNDDANYVALFSYVKRSLEKYGVRDGIVADLGCGTGDLTIMLAKAGYDMIGVDISEEMLSVFREKSDESGVTDILLLKQDITKLDLFGTVRAAISTFDTLNHIGDYEKFVKTLKRTALFIEPGGVFVFDLNSVYKQQSVLADNTFILEADDARCEWKNKYDDVLMRTLISISITYKAENSVFNESFYEYAFTKEQIYKACDAAGLTVKELCDGEKFTEVEPESERYIVTAIKNG